jgi:hypothetical protein
VTRTKTCLHIVDVELFGESQTWVNPSMALRFKLKHLPRKKGFYIYNILKCLHDSTVHRDHWVYAGIEGLTANNLVCHMLHPWLEGNSPHFQLLYVHD